MREKCKKGICPLCNKEKELRNVHDGKRICRYCHEKYFYISQECDLCHEYAVISSKKNGIKICENCYSTLYNIEYNKNYKRPLHICCECGKEKLASKITEKGYVCQSCYECPKQICSICGNKNIVQKYINKQPICPKCYEPPKQICSLCNKENIISTYINEKPVCKICYESPQNSCSICGNIGSIAKYIDEKPIGYCCYEAPKKQCACGNIGQLTKGKCRTCYNEEYEKREYVHIIKLLRGRVKTALDKFTKTGKIKHADEYGINYEAIIKQLGPYPGPRENYHIDHIFPLIAFDLNNPIHIRAAFAPENHQWLTVNENLSKGDRYDKVAFEKYLNNFIKNNS
jgi:hypothetical protein